MGGKTAVRHATPDDKVEIGFLEGVLRRLPGDVLTLQALGDLYTRTGLLREGLEVDQALCQCCPGDPVVWYNLACSRALMGETEAAIEALCRAVSLGYDDFAWMRRDKDLATLHDDARFKELMS
jgi:predicted Zn-dependent protease